MAQHLAGVHRAGGRAPPEDPAHLRARRATERGPDRRRLHALAFRGLASPEAAQGCGSAPVGEDRQGSLLLGRQALPRAVARRVAELHPGARVSQFHRLGERRFGPLFWTQFLGAANDNLFKFAFTLLATYHAIEWGGLDARSVGFVIGAIFIAPFLLLSATSGQLADKIEKGRLMRLVKNLEIAIMALAAYGFAAHQAAALYVCVFLMGCHSTLFGPVKYAYLPQHLSAAELTSGNGLVEMGTFIAILLGTMAGGILAGDVGAQYVAWACVIVAVLGRIAPPLF